MLVWPVRVQGETCAAEVAAAIRGFNAIAPGAGAAARRADGARRWQPRGPLGFSDEAVVRAAAESAIPLISRLARDGLDAAGHAADARADADQGRRVGGAHLRRSRRGPCQARAAPIDRTAPPRAGRRGAPSRRRRAGCRGSRTALAAAPALRCRRRPPRALLPRLAAEAPYAPCATPRPATGRRFARPSAAPALRGPARRLGRALLANAGVHATAMRGRAHAACRAPGAGFALPGAARRTRAPCRARAMAGSRWSEAGSRRNRSC